MNATEERAAVLRSRLEELRKDRLIGEEQGRAASAVLEVPWRIHGVVVQAVFFLLTCAAAGAFYGAVRTEWVVGVASLLVAEYLIRLRRWWWTGVEAALWLAGVFSFIAELPRSGTPESHLVVAAGLAAAGARLRNPVFGTAALIFVVVYAEERFDLGTVVALVLGACAVAGLLRSWRRPSTEWLLSLLALVMPVAAIAAADVRWHALTMAMLAAFGLTVLGVAVRRPHHALFLSGTIAVAIPAGDAIDALPLMNEAKLAIGGILLLGIAAGVSRVLRGRTRGLVSTAERVRSLEEAAMMAGTIAVASPDVPHESRSEEGGEFGGAGATGRWQ